MFNNKKNSGKSNGSKGNGGKDDGEFKMDILCKIRRDIVSNRNQEKIGEDRLYVVKYAKGEPRVEKRNYYLDEGELRMGKLKGLTLADFEIIDEKWDDIKKALGGKKASK